MKKLTYLLLFIGGFANAQNVNFAAGSNFRGILLITTSVNNIAFNAAGISIEVDANNNGTIQLSEAANVYELYLPDGSNCNDLQGILSFVNLRKLRCKNQSIVGNFNLSSMDNLIDLNCSTNSITNLLLPNPAVTVLQSLDYSNNQIVNNFDASRLTSIQTLACGNNGFSTTNFNLDHTVLPSLKILRVNNNLFANLDLSNFSNLEELTISSNPISNLVLTGCNALQTLNMQSCPNMLSITLNMFPNLTALSVDNCSNLLFIEAKNGQNVQISLDGFCTSLTSICVEEQNIAAVSAIIPILLQNSISVNSYCTPTPGGIFNTVKGNVSLTLPSQRPHPFVKLKLQIGNDTYYSTTDELGDYVFYTRASGPFSVSFAFENQSSFSGNAPLSGNFAPSPNGTTFVGNFVLAPVALSANDMEMVIAPADPETPLSKTYLVTIKNNGNNVASGDMKIQYKNNLLGFTAPNLTDSSLLYSNFIASPDPNITITNWEYVGLQPFESKSFKLSFSDLDPGGTAIPAFGVSIAALNDINGINNTFDMVDARYQPNSIICLEATSLPNTAIGDYLHYMINYQNPSVNEVATVVIENSFDPQRFDISSLQILASYKDSVENDRNFQNNQTESLQANPEETVVLNVKNNTATYTFRKGRLSGNPNGAGAVLLKIKTNDLLPDNSSVSNGVRIIFDYLAPVTTEQETTNFVNNLSRNEVEDTSIKVFPNPVQNQITISGASILKNVQLYDIQGRLLETNIKNDNNYTLDISSRASGVYFLKVTSERGSKVVRIVKQ